jgi:hypothetical protein
VRIRSFQYLCGLTVLLTHIIAVVMVATATRFSEVTDQIGSILIVAPITIIYASAFVRYVVNNATPASAGSEERFDPMAAATMYLVVGVFCASLLYVVISFVYLSNYQVNEFKMWLGASETAFGALIGIVFERLFGVQPSASASPPARSGYDGRAEPAPPGNV